MTFIRKVKVKNNTYLVEVKSVREGDKIKQKFIRYLGKDVEGKPVRQTSTDCIQLLDVKRSLDVLAVDKIMDDLKLKSIIKPQSLAFVYSQILGNKSINKLEEWFKRTEIPDVLGIHLTTKILYDALTDLSETDFTEIEEQIFSYLEKYEKPSKATVIDVTDTYFEGKKHSSKRRRGKDSKVRHLLQIGLAATLDHGFPMFHRIYHGNLSNTQIFKDMIIRLKNKDIDPLIMDRGMVPPDNLDILLGFEVPAIAGLRRTDELQRYLDSIDREKLYTLEHRVELKKTSVFIKSYSYRKGRLIVVYNPSLEVVKRELNFAKGKENKYVGYSFIYHNTDISDKNVVKKYYEKDIIERAFKQVKGLLNVRPVRVWIQKHVEGHVRICYLAYAVLSLINYRLRRKGISAVDALESLQHGYKVTLKDRKNNFKWDLTVPLEPNQTKMLKALGVVTKT